MRRLGIGVVVFVAAASLSAAGFAARSPKSLLASILRNARAHHSVHYVGTDYAGAAWRITTTADVARDRGIAHITDTFEKKSSSITVVVLRDIAYVRGSTGELETDLGLTGSRFPPPTGSFATWPPE